MPFFFESFEKKAEAFFSPLGVGEHAFSLDPFVSSTLLISSCGFSVVGGSVLSALFGKLLIG
jgi:hypothetical protein